MIRKKFSDSDLDQKLAKTFFFCSKIFKHKKAALPQLRDLATNKVRNNFAGFDSGSISKRHGFADSDPYQKVTDQQQCAQLLVKVSTLQQLLLLFVKNVKYVHITI